MRLLWACWKKKLQFRNNGLAPQNRSMKKTDYRTHVAPGRLPCLHIAAVARGRRQLLASGGAVLGDAPILGKSCGIDRYAMAWARGGVGVLFSAAAANCFSSSLPGGTRVMSASPSRSF